MNDKDVLDCLPKILALLKKIQYKDWKFIVNPMGNRFYLQVAFDAPDGDSNKVEEQHGRKWYISTHMTTSEIVQTALKAVLTAEEHEARENFLYCGKRIFGPHIHVDCLLDICEDLDVRDEAGREEDVDKRSFGKKRKNATLIDKI